jgi:hypothetical protein
MKLFYLTFLLAHIFPLICFDLCEICFENFLLFFSLSALIHLLQLSSFIWSFSCLQESIFSCERYAKIINCLRIMRTPHIKQTIHNDLNENEEYETKKMLNYLNSRSTSTCEWYASRERSGMSKWPTRELEIAEKSFGFSSKTFWLSLLLLWLYSAPL